MTIRAHFTEKRRGDSLLDRGKQIRCTEERFKDNNSRVTVFDMIANRYTKQQFFVMCVANCMYGAMAFPYDPPLAVRNYNLFYKRRQMMNELVSEDLRTLFIVRRVRPDDWRSLLQLYLCGAVAFETLVCINRFVRFTEHFSKKESIISGVIDDELLLRIERSERFVKITDTVKDLIFQRYDFLIKDKD